MKQLKIKSFVLAAGTLMLFPMPKFAYAFGLHPSLATVQEEARETTQAMSAILANPKANVSQNVLDSADCLVNISRAVQGGFIFGGTYGHGLATCRTENGWSQPAYYTLKIGNFGAIAGLQSVDILFALIGDNARSSLESGQLTLGGDYNVVAGGNDIGGADLGDQTVFPRDNVTIVTYTLSRGLLVNVSLKGGILQPLDRFNAVAYAMDKEGSVNKEDLSAASILSRSAEESTPDFLAEFTKVIAAHDPQTQNLQKQSEQIVAPSTEMDMKLEEKNAAPEDQATPEDQGIQKDIIPEGDEAP